MTQRRADLKCGEESTQAIRPLLDPQRSGTYWHSRSSRSIGFSGWRGDAVGFFQKVTHLFENHSPDFGVLGLLEGPGVPFNLALHFYEGTLHNVESATKMHIDIPEMLYTS